MCINVTNSIIFLFSYFLESSIKTNWEAIFFKTEIKIINLKSCIPYY